MFSTSMAQGNWEFRNDPQAIRVHLASAMHLSAAFRAAASPGQAAEQAVGASECIFEIPKGQVHPFFSLYRI